MRNQLMPATKDILIMKGLVLLCMIFAGCSLAKNWQPDNPIEELAEQIIQDQTGLDIDLTPGNPDAYRYRTTNDVFVSRFSPDNCKSS